LRKSLPATDRAKPPQSLAPSVLGVSAPLWPITSPTAPCWRRPPSRPKPQPLSKRDNSHRKARRQMPIVCNFPPITRTNNAKVINSTIIPAPTMQNTLRSRTRSKSITDKIALDRGQDPIRSRTRSHSITDKIRSDHGQDRSRSRTGSEWITDQIGVDRGLDPIRSRPRSKWIQDRNRVDHALDRFRSWTGTDPILRRIQVDHGQE
jgi:hypothetical protein